ncbi:benzoate 4-monooxygenase cytochrome-like protein P450 [Setomelanomma holmii]|uniref:Benzoate 4-monooxygenase cytochrome-like protein P450 n=1 Tax=Setomelanomma holmii TaxID=210430 RepID=A0A9P4H694_9PLEO|nr:benzoate 4-monooxygenase cytochrome-like protein P450 [Setomelanomma holmii]
MLYIVSKLLSYVALCAFIATLWISGKALYNIYVHALRKYPGPKTWAATRLTWALAMQSGDYHRKIHELHEKYGPIVRVAPDELSFINAEAWKDIYGNLNIQKNRVWAGQEEEHHPISIVSTDEPTHLRNRRALAGAFTDHAVAEHASVLENLTTMMMTKFEAAVMAGQGSAVVDMADWMNFLTFDISGAFSFGESFDCISSGRAHPWVAIACGFGKGIALMASINFYRPLNKMLKLAMPKSIMQKMDYHRQISHEKFEQRLAMEHKMKAQDYVGSIAAYNDEKGEVKIPKEEMEANMTLLIFAGSETTSTAMTAILNQLLQNASATSRVQDEVRSAFASKGEITVATVAHLKYLDAVIQEGIRIGPPAAVGLPRITPEAGALILGEHVPGHTFVSVNQYPAFRSASNFTHSNQFIPERFTDKSPFPTDRLHAFEPFLVGRHKCIGQKLAWSIMRLTLARLLYSFNMKVVDGLEDFGDQKTYIFWEKRPMQVELQNRA